MLGFIAVIMAVMALFLSSACAEIVVVTKPLPDSEGEMWPREYFDVTFAMFVMPERFMIDNGINKVPVMPSKTRTGGDPGGEATVEKAWVNIIDLERKRYFSGNLNSWYPLDSTEVLRIREGYDTCMVKMRSCPGPRAPSDSCRTASVILHDSLTIEDISYVVYTCFDHLGRGKRSVYAKAGYFYRTILNYIVRDVRLEQVADMSDLTDSSAVPIQCNCFVGFKPKSILEVIYRGDPRPGRD